MNFKINPTLFTGITASQTIQNICSSLRTRLPFSSRSSSSLLAPQRWLPSTASSSPPLNPKAWSSPATKMAISSPYRLSLSLPSIPSRLSVLPIKLKATVRLAKAAPFRAVRLHRVVIREEEGDMGDGFFEAVEELERMVRDPSDVLGEMVDRLSSRELQLMLVYFGQEGRDSYCALEVFDWLRKENRVDGETMELMASIACAWVERMVAEGSPLEEVVELLDEVVCVGLDPEFSMAEKVVSVFWDRGKKEEAVEFVSCVKRRGGIGGREIGDGNGGKGGLVGYLIWKIMGDGNYLDAVKLVIDFKERGLQPEIYSYLIAMTALVKEQQELSKSLRKLRSSIKAGLVAPLDEENTAAIERYQSDLLRNGVLLSEWALQGGGSAICGVVHKRLLALYACAGRGLEAEQQFWEIKLSGKEPDRELYDIVLAICASQNEAGSVRRLLAGMEVSSAEQRKKTLLWLLRGYVKGGHYSAASEILMKMLDLGLYPEYLDRAAVLQGLRKSIHESGNVEPYLRLCKHLSDKDLIGPCLVYLHINSHKLWIIKSL